MKLDMMSEIQTGTPLAGATKPVERAAAKSAAPSAPAATGSKSAPAPAAGVTVTLSAPPTGTAAEVVDTGKVESVKTAIANGSFTVNAEAIADKLLSNASEMLAASRR